MPKLEPILYPFHGQVLDTRSDLHLTVGDFKERLRQTKPINVIRHQNTNQVITLNGIYNNLFCTITQINSYLKNIHRVDYLNDDVKIDNRSLMPSKNIKGESLKKYYLKNEVYVIGPNLEMRSELDLKMMMMSDALTDLLISLLPSNPEYDTKFINLFCFMLEVSKIIQGIFNISSYQELRWITDHPVISETEYLSNSRFYTESPGIRSIRYTVVSHPDKSLVLSGAGISYEPMIKYGIKYDIYWFHGRLSAEEVIAYWKKCLINKFAAMHLSHTFSHNHIHVFRSEIDLLKYYCYCLYRTYEAQNKFQNTRGITNIDRRGYYGLLLNERSYKYLYNIFNFSPQVLFGIPMPAADIRSIPLRLNDFVNMMRDYIDDYVLENHYQYANSRGCFIYHAMYKLVVPAAIKDGYITTLRQYATLLPDVQLTLSNVAEIDVPTNDSIVIGEYSSTYEIIRKFPPEFDNCQLDLNNIKTYFMYDKFDYDQVIEFTFEDTRSADISDIVVLRNFRMNYGITKATKDNFMQNVQPENIRNKYLAQEYINDLSFEKKLFYCGYCFAAVPNYTFPKGGGSKEVLMSSLYTTKLNDVNSSTFKLYALVWKYIILPRVEILRERIELCFCGAIDERNVGMFNRLANDNWFVFGIGADARGSNIRMNIKSALGVDSADYVVSDIDFAIIKNDDVDGCVNLAIELFTIIYNVTNKIGIFKIEYGLSSVILAICNICKCEYKIVKSVGSTPGSIELFIIFWKDKPITKRMTIEYARTITLLNSIVDKPAKPLMAVGYDYYRKMSPNNPDAMAYCLLCYYIDSKNYQDVVSFISTFCGYTRVGRIGDNLTGPSSGVAYGITTLDRLCLYLRNSKFFQYTNLLNTELRLNGRIRTDHLRISSIGPSTNFTNAQRYSLASLLDIYMNNHKVYFGDVVRDVGCRNFHGVIFNRFRDHEYHGYDMNPSIVAPDRDIQYHNQEVKYGDVVNFLKDPCLVVVYNSLFMTYDSNAILYHDIVAAIKGVQEDSCLILSFYVCDDEILRLVEENCIGTAKKVVIGGVNEIHVSLGAYEPVACLTPAQYDKIVDGSEFDGKVKIAQTYVSKSDLYHGALAYGRFPNGQADYLLPLYNTVQRAIICLPTTANGESVKSMVRIT